MSFADKLRERLSPTPKKEGGNGYISSEAFFTTIGCIYNGCGSLEFLAGPSGGMCQNICCAKCGAKYNDTGMGIHSLHSMQDQPSLTKYTDPDPEPEVDLGANSLSE